MNPTLEKIKNTLTSVPKGLRVTWLNLTRTKFTQRYPEVMPEPMGRAEQQGDDGFGSPYHLSPRYRGLHGLTRDPVTGDHNCIGCMACAKVCPDDLISMDLEKREGHSGRYPVTFTVNIGPCCFCGLCAEVCPTPMRAIVMTDCFEWATYARDGRNLVLTKEDLERLGDREVARRAAGRTFAEDGSLVDIVPEEEGNPYFQFAVESGKTLTPTREEKGPRAAPVAEAPAAPAVDPMVAVREAFAAVGLEPPADVVGFDLDTLESIEDRKLKAQCKSAVMKARKALAAEAPAAPAEPPADPMAAVREAFAAVGLEPPADIAGFDLDTLDSIEDRKLRGQCKSAVMKARKALEAEPVAAPAEEPAPEPSADGPEALRAAMQAVLAEAGVAVPDDLAGFDLGSLDAIEDRKLRGRAKSAVRKVQKSLGLVD